MKQINLKYKRLNQSNQSRMSLPVTREGLVITESVDNLLIGEDFVDLRPISFTVLMATIQKS
jgi:hypothetical protein